MIILWELLQQGGDGLRNSFFQDWKTHSSFLGTHFSYRAQKTMRAALQLQFYVSIGFWGDKHSSNLAQKMSIFLINTDPEEKMQQRGRAGASFPSSEQGEVFTPSHWASLCPVSWLLQLQRSGCTRACRDWGTIPNPKNQHFTSLSQWTLALSDKMHDGFSCVSHHPWCYNRPGGLSLVADESLASSSIPRPTSFQTQSLRVQPYGEGGWDTREDTTLSLQTASPQM